MTVEKGHDPGSAQVGRTTWGRLVSGMPLRGMGLGGVPHNWPNAMNGVFEPFTNKWKRWRLNVLLLILLNGWLNSPNFCLLGIGHRGIPD